MPLYMYDFKYLMIILPFLLLAMYSQVKISSTFNKYSKVKNTTDYTGAEIARIILDRNNLQHVKITQVNGNLSDHYDPRTETVALSTSVYASNSVAAGAVAAHEVGHALQHANGYVPLKLRSAMAPVVSIASNFVWLVMMIGFIAGSMNFINFAVILFGATVAFQIITLPVEFNASSRALSQLDNGLIGHFEASGAKKVLNAAALTYVAATLVALVQLLQLISRSRNND